MQFNPLQFNELSLRDKIIILQKDGEYIDYIKQDGKYIDLYFIDSFYVQIVHSRMLFGINSIDIISNKDERLGLFIDKIQLTDIINN